MSEDQHSPVRWVDQKARLAQVELTDSQLAALAEGVPVSGYGDAPIVRRWSSVEALHWIDAELADIAQRQRELRGDG